jgi:PAS domain S-box-containing protein
MSGYDRSSLRNNIVITFVLVILIGGILSNLMIHTLLPSHMKAAGWDDVVIEYVDRELAIYGAGTAMAGICAVFIVSVFLSSAITRPLRKIDEGMQAMAAGNWSTRINIDNRDEFGRLAEGFNMMASHIESVMRELESAMSFTESILLSVPSIMIVVDDSHRPITHNAALEKLRQQYPSVDVNDFIAMLSDEIDQTLRSGCLSRKEITMKPGGDGVTVIFSAIVSPLSRKIDGGPVRGGEVLLTISDVTEKKKMKEMVMQSRQDWEDTFNTIPDMITIHDKDYNIIMANKAAKENLHLPDFLQEFPNKCFKYYHGTEAPPEGCPSCNCYKTERPATFEIFEPNLGKHIEIRAIPRKNRYDELIGLIHIVRDITERKKIEEEYMNLMNAVTKAKVEWEQTFDSAMEQIAIIDSEMNIIRCNRSFAEYTARSVDQLIGRKWHEFFPSSDTITSIRDKLSLGFTEPLTSEVETEDGKWFLININPIRENRYASHSYVVILTDITDIKEIQEKLEKSEKELKKKVDELERFFDMAVGRELKMKEMKKELDKLRSRLRRIEHCGAVRN